MRMHLVNAGVDKERGAEDDDHGEEQPVAPAKAEERRTDDAGRADPALVERLFDRAEKLFDRFDKAIETIEALGTKAEPEEPPKAPPKEGEEEPPVDPPPNEDKASPEPDEDEDDDGPRFRLHING